MNIFEREIHTDFKPPETVRYTKMLSAVNLKYFHEEKYDQLHSKCVETAYQSASKRTFNHVHTTLEKKVRPIFDRQGVPLIITHHDMHNPA